MTEMQQVGLVLMIVPVVVVASTLGVILMNRLTGSDVDLVAIFLAVAFLVGFVLFLAGGAS